ncbi:MAG: PadR family transcriptional regulator [Longimicrobiales bacterium]|nr:PadR family transcriptional regulator [Longimicrobiales bacterium]
MLKGTLDLLILKCLSMEPMHGYGLTTWLEEQSGERVSPGDSATYQALHRLEADGLVEAEWDTSDNNRRARYYHITPSGRAKLTESEKQWRDYTDIVTRLLDLPGLA